MITQKDKGIGRSAWTDEHFSNRTSDDNEYSLGSDNNYSPDTKTQMYRSHTFSEGSKYQSNSHQKSGCSRRSTYDSQADDIAAKYQQEYDDSEDQSSQPEAINHASETKVIHQNRLANKNANIQSLYSEEGDGSIFIETDKLSGKKQLVTMIDISTLYKEKRAKSVSLARTYATLYHRNLIEVKKLYITKKTLFFEMEAPDNTGSWKSFCKRKFSTLDILVIFRQICSALEHLHKNNIVHRDVHPTRIHFLNGFAKFNHIGMPYNYKKLLKKENFSGHINYSAPELILEDTGFDDKVDIWSLGCCLYYLYTKNDPFEGKTPAIIKKNILNESIMKGKTGIDPIIRDLLNACLVVNPDDRPNATKLLKIQNDLEYDYYGECVSKISSNYNRTENGKYAIFGSPQSTYKVYNNNYLPPASLRNRKSNEIKKTQDSQQEGSKDEYLEDLVSNEVVVPAEVIASKPTVVESQVATEPTVKPELNLAYAAVPTPSEIPPETVIKDDTSAAIQMNESKAWHDYTIFNEDEVCDYSWLGKKYLLEQDSHYDEIPRRRFSSHAYEGDDEDFQQLSKSDVNAVSKRSEINSEGFSKSEVSKQLCNLSGSSELNKMDKNLLKSLNAFEKLDQYHCVESNGAMFVGEAIKHGIGILFDKDPTTNQTLTYKGEFKYDMRDGTGQQIYKDGTVYNGNWKKDKPHGFGILLFPDGKQKYEGNFENGFSQGWGMTIQAEASSLNISYSDTFGEELSNSQSNLTSNSKSESLRSQDTLEDLGSLETSSDFKAFSNTKKCQ